MNTENTTMETPPRRRSTSKEQIHRLLAERQQMLLLMCGLNGMLGPEKDPQTGRKLQDFCQILMDYIAAGHFGLYQRIISDTERRQEVIRRATEIYPEIDEVTRIALAFNERYQEMGDLDNADALARDLSELGEVLTARIELEDELIAAMGLRIPPP